MPNFSKKYRLWLEIGEVAGFIIVISVYAFNQFTPVDWMADCASQSQRD